MSGRPDEDGERELMLLAAVWDQTVQRWRDGAARRFETDHWAPLYQESRAFLAALQALLDLIEAAEDPTTWM